MSGRFEASPASRFTTGMQFTVIIFHDTIKQVFRMLSVSYQTHMYSHKCCLLHRSVSRRYRHLLLYSPKVYETQKLHYRVRLMESFLDQGSQYFALICFASPPPTKTLGLSMVLTFRKHAVEAGIPPMAFTNVTGVEQFFEVEIYPSQRTTNATSEEYGD
ncbi:hypothetical protein M422DRAFT_45614 [Sphaerobolus stellatus SS14]|uniref:Uncharacterized protein n=1 Tax=Sphaerobolus stellatus (strain SS14) TaxID=990650 RepID=A0A0C9W5W2_SPHS4|nr:hypothetical protein M422DRAFT_45614 [Sphaerobolus stellatus SS14]